MITQTYSEQSDVIKSKYSHYSCVNQDNSIITHNLRVHVCASCVCAIDVKVLKTYTYVQ